jgi:hypothetical protein
MAASDICSRARMFGTCVASSAMNIARISIKPVIEEPYLLEYNVLVVRKKATGVSEEHVASILKV